MVSSNKRDYNIDLIRILATIGIVCYHYSVYSNHPFRNDILAPIWNTSFFMFSGYLIYSKYSHFTTINDIKAFYISRFKRIFPIFYLIWMYFYLETVSTTKSFFYLGKPLNLIFTLFGLDGYLSQRFSTYYQIGEWFLGAMIICYILYPFVLYLYKQNKSIFFLSLLVMFYVYNSFSIPRVSIVFPSVFECVFQFVLGMLFFDYKNELVNKNMIVIEVIAILLSFFFNPIKSFLMASRLYGFVWFAILYYLGSVLTRYEATHQSLQKLSNLSFIVLLIQHKVVLKMVNMRNPMKLYKVVAYIFIIVFLCFALAYLIDTMYKKLRKIVISNSKIH